MRNSLSSFGRPRLDRLALRGYRRERITEFTVPVALALMEGGFVGVVADKVYHVTVEVSTSLGQTLEGRGKVVVESA